MASNLSKNAQGHKADMQNSKWKGPFLKIAERAKNGLLTNGKQFSTVTKGNDSPCSNLYNYQV